MNDSLKSFKNSDNQTNQELLSELEKKLPFFNQDEIMRVLELTMMNVPNHYKEKLFQLDPQQANDWMKESFQQLEKEKINKQVEEIKKMLGYDEKKKKG